MTHVDLALYISLAINVAVGLWLVWRRSFAWYRHRYAKMSSEELQARIAADMTDADVDRFLPPSLRRHGQRDTW